MVYNTDDNLMLIERNVVSQLLLDRSIQSFFLEHPKSTFEYYEIQNKLIKLKSSFPFQNPIYMYNESDDLIISDSGACSLETFGDKDFLLSNYSQATTFIRKDWLDQLKLLLPTTTDQFVDTMRAFKEHDPGNTGGKVIPYSYIDCSI